jgi:putative membrane protein
MTTSSSEATESIFGSVPPLRAWLKTFVIGLCMGSADAVPGVSGGTIALIAGIYERLIAAITAITPERAVRFLGALSPTGGGVSAREAVGVLEEVDVWFLLALVGGIGTAIVIVARIVHVASQETPVLLYGVLFGLIGASAVILLRELRIETLVHALAAVVGFVVAFVLSGPASPLGTEGLAVVFLAGAVAVSAMILPGISGSLLLVILGQYERMSGALSDFVDALIGLVTGGPAPSLVDAGTLVVTFMLGGLVGLFTVSRLIRRALDANRGATLAFLVALVVGALRAPITELSTRDGVTWTAETIGVFAAVAAVGAVLVLVVDWYAVDLDFEAV